MKRVLQTKRQQILGLDTHIKRIIRESGCGGREYWEAYYGGKPIWETVEILEKKLKQLKETDAT